MSFKMSKTWTAINNILNYFTATTSGDDEGITVLGGQFSVGSPDDPRESVFGEGDSYPVTKAFHCDTANESGLVITSATDVTDILQSDTGSSTGLFGGTAIGKFILVYSEHKFGGAKVKNAATATIDADNIQGKYLYDNTPTWVNVPYMVTDSNYPYTQKADEIGSCASCSEQWRFGFNPDNLPVPWDEVTMTINGTEYTGYWARFEVVGILSEDLTIEQLKLHTNRFEINAEGVTEYFGRARYAKDLVMHWHLTEELQGFSPSNENIDFASNLSLVFTDNEFTQFAIDGRGGYIVIPQGIDTSIPLTIEVLWIPLTSATGDVKYEILTSPKRVGDLMDLSTAADSETALVSIDNQDNELQQTSIYIDISKLKPGEILGFGLKRLGTDVEDTFSGSVALINIRAIGGFWTP